MTMIETFQTGIEYGEGRVSLLHLVPTSDTTNSALCGSRVRVLRRATATKLGERCPDCQEYAAAEPVAS